MGYNYLSISSQPICLPVWELGFPHGQSLFWVELHSGTVAWFDILKNDHDASHIAQYISANTFHACPKLTTKAKSRGCPQVMGRSRALPPTLSCFCRGAGEHGGVGVALVMISKLNTAGSGPCVKLQGGCLTRIQGHNSGIPRIWMGEKLFFISAPL